MNKKSSIMSLSVDPEIQERLKKHALKRKVSVSKLVRDMVEKFIGTEDTEGAFDTVILKIPAEVKANEAELRKWMELRIEGVVKTLTS